MKNNLVSFCPNSYLFLLGFLLPSIFDQQHQTMQKPSAVKTDPNSSGLLSTKHHITIKKKEKDT